MSVLLKHFTNAHSKVKGVSTTEIYGLWLVYCFLFLSSLFSWGGYVVIPPIEKSVSDFILIYYKVCTKSRMLLYSTLGVGGADEVPHTLLGRSNN
jgi:hypothetical protein